jgi:N utilization substance protein A
MEVIVEDRQLSLAIGKKGQNVRLAAKLTGWRIDIKSEEEKRREVEAQFEGLEAGAESAGVESAAAESAGPETAEATGNVGTADEPRAEDAPDTPLPYTLAGIGEKTVRKLAGAGFASIEALAAASVEQLSDISGIGEKTAEKILSAAKGESAEVPPPETAAAE